MINVVPKTEEVLTMRIDFHLMGTERKALVRAISEIIGEEAEFTFTSGQKDTQHKTLETLQTLWQATKAS